MALRQLYVRTVISRPNQTKLLATLLEGLERPVQLGVRVDAGDDGSDTRPALGNGRVADALGEDPHLEEPVRELHGD